MDDAKSENCLAGCTDFFVAMAMNRLKFRHFPVAESTRSGLRLLGIVSKYDIARGFPANLNPFSLEVVEDSVSRPVSSVMTKKLITTTPDCPIEEAARTLRSSRIGALPVLKENRLVGIITQSDIFDAFVNMTAAKSGGVRILVESEVPDNPLPSVLELSRQYRVDILSIIWFHDVVTVEPYCAVEEAVRILRARRINALPVVRSGNLVGIITENDIYDALLDMTGANAKGTRLVVESDDVKTALVSMAQLTERLQLQIMNALSFHDKISPNKVTSAFHLSGKSNSHFTEELRKAGFRVLKID